MSKTTDIINKALAEGYVVPEEIIAAADTSKPYMTDALADEAVFKQFGQYPILSELKDPEATAPTIFKILGAIGLDDDPKDMAGARTGLQKFIEDYPKKRKEWETKLKDTEGWGNRGAKTMNEVWKMALHDQAVQDAQKARSAALAGDNVLEKAVGFASRILAPRSREAWERGEDASWKDIAGDAAEGALYFVPGGVYSKVFAKGLRMVPKIGRALSKAAGNKVASTIVGSAAAPALVEGVDAVLYDSDNERGDFSLVDAGLGTATNMGVNTGLYGAMARGVPILMGKIGRGAGTETARRGIESIGHLTGDAGKEALENASNIIKKGYVKPDEIPTQVLLGKKPTDIIDEGKYLDAVAFKEFADRIPFMDYPDSKTLKALGLTGKKPIPGASAADFAEFVAKNPEDKAIVEGVLKGPYAADAMDLLRGAKMGKSDRVADILRAGAPTEAVNKYGSRRDADLAISRVGIKDDIAALEKDDKKEREKKKASRIIGGIGKVNALDDRDEHFLRIIADNPDVLKVGYAPERDAFNRWMLERGHSLLSGSTLARPVWELQ